MSNLLAAIRAREAAISDVRIVLTATTESTPDRFTSMTMNISANHSDPDLVRKLITISERSCIVTNTLRSAIPISINFEDAAVATS